MYLINGTITTTVKAIGGNGGNITLAPKFIVLKNGRIKANASKGNGGNIDIDTLSIYQFSSEDLTDVISASSELGIDGEIEIDSPDVDMEGFLVVLPGGFIEDTELAKPYEIQDLSELSTFKKRSSYEGMPMAPKDFQE